MAEFPRDPLLQPLRVTALPQQIVIVVALEHQRVETIQHLLHVHRQRTGVGQEPQAVRAVAEYKLRRFARVVRHRIRLDLDITHRKPLVTIENAHGIDLRETFCRRLRTTVGNPHRDIEFSGKARSAADVIVVLVRDQNRVQGISGNAAAGQPRHRIAEGKSAVGKNSRCADFNQQAIAFAAAAQRCEAHHW